jgi:DNA-binding transcriptional LysR family regulator
LVFVCAPSHPLANRAQVDIADLIAEELIGFPTGWGIRRSVDTAFATIGAQPRPTYEVAD